MFISAQKDGLQLNDPEPTLEELGTVALTKRRWKGVLKIETLLVIAIGLVSYVLSAVAGSVLSFFRHGYDFSVHLHDLSQQNIPASCGRRTQQWSHSETLKSFRRVWSKHSKITVPLSPNGLYALVEGAADGSVTFIADHSLENAAFVDLWAKSRNHFWKD